MRLNSHPSGRHFLQIPGPTNVPDRILRAMDYPTIDHRGPEFNALAKKVLRSVRQVFQTKQPVIVYPASGTGAWEAALVNTLSAGDRDIKVNLIAPNAYTRMAGDASEGGAVCNPGQFQCAGAELQICNPAQDQR